VTVARLARLVPFISHALSVPVVWCCQRILSAEAVPGGVGGGVVPVAKLAVIEWLAVTLLNV
jgi:hypothetical protein